MKTITKVQKQLNPNLKIDGILITMTDSRTNLSKHISNEVRDKYGLVKHTYEDWQNIILTDNEYELYSEEDMEEYFRKLKEEENRK